MQVLVGLMCKYVTLDACAGVFLIVRRGSVASVMSVISRGSLHIMPLRARIVLLRHHDPTPKWTQSTISFLSASVCSPSLGSTSRSRR